MRSLLPIEREVLLLSGSGIRLRDHGPREPELLTAIYSCVSLGRMRLVRRFPLAKRGERARAWRTELTDLGRLALRVSVPGASVLP